MKRVGVLLGLALIMLLSTASIAFGATLEIEKTSPKDGSTGMAVDNMGVKVFFNEEVYSKENKEANTKLCKLVDKKGREIPSKVIFTSEQKNVLLVIADVQEGKKTIKGKTEYSLVIEEGFKAASGNILEKEETITFETLDPKSSMTISMVMMGLMVVGMVFFTTREAKKQVKENTKTKEQKVNPYKVAKETGQSVESVVEKDQKKKAKAQAAREKKNRHKKEKKVEIATNNFKVKGPKPISAVGAKYKHAKAKPKKSQSKSTNPKNRTGKQKNKKK